MKLPHSWYYLFTFHLLKLLHWLAVKKQIGCISYINTLAVSRKRKLLLQRGRRRIKLVTLTFRRDNQKKSKALQVEHIMS